MSVVFRGVPDGEEIMQEFGGDAKKKVFLYWKPGRARRCIYPPFEGRSMLFILAVAEYDHERIYCKLYMNAHFPLSLCVMLLFTTF